MKYSFLTFGMLLALTGTAAQAETGITASVSTLGAGLHVSLPVAEKTNVRFGINALSSSSEDSTEDVDYDFKLKLATVDALVDYFPMAGTFRLTGGLVYNGNKAEFSGRADSGTYTLNGRVYAASTVGSLDGEMKFRKVATYLGIGWGNAVAADKGWGFSSDIGVLLQGSPETSLWNRGCTAGAAACAQIASDVAAENRQLQEDVSDFKAYPVVRFGVSYKF